MHRYIQYVSSWSAIVSKGSIPNGMDNCTTICDFSDLGATRDPFPQITLNILATKRDHKDIEGLETRWGKTVLLLQFYVH